MSYIHTVQLGISAHGTTISETQRNYTNEGGAGFDVSVPDSSTDMQVDIAFDVSQVVAFTILSSQNVTLETNNGAAPADTISLVAGVAYHWDTDSYDTFQIATDVTAFFFTNASGAAATVQCRVTYDATP